MHSNLTPYFRGFVTVFAVILLALFFLFASIMHATAAPPMQPPAADEDWQSAKPEHGPAPADKKLEAPAGSFGFWGCGHWSVWVFLKNGKSYRYDDETTPLSPADKKKLFDWLDTGPTDIYEPKSCGTTV